MLQCFSVRRFIVGEWAETERFIRRAQKAIFIKIFPALMLIGGDFPKALSSKVKTAEAVFLCIRGEDFVRERMIRRKWFGKREPGKFLLSGEYD